MTPASSPRVAITTSWDDGHPNDLKLVELLAKYQIGATLYIPRSGQTPVLEAAQIRELSQYCEIGAHTLTHPDLLKTPDEEAKAEIEGSRDWVEQVTGKQCVMFCFPRGHFRPVHLKAVGEAGFSGCRTVEMLSIARPAGPGLKLMGTTIQAYPHGGTAYLRNLLKRGRGPSPLHIATLFSRSRDWVRLVGPYLREAQEHNGVFHLWGHSWELDGQWSQLEEALSMMKELASEADFVTNGELCNR